MSNSIQAIDTTNDIKQKVIEICKAAKAAANKLAIADTDKKNEALKIAAEELISNSDKILEANAKDVAEAEARGTKGSFLDRLTLDEGRVKAIADGLKQIAELPDPVGRRLDSWERPNGLQISRVATPIGVIGVIYESRPNVTADAGALCLKSGNAAVLRGGSESFHSSTAIMNCLQTGLEKAGLDKKSIQLIPYKDREAVGVMLSASDYIDVIVPRGGKGLIQRIIDDSKIPLFQHLEGNCHTYINESANQGMAIEVLVNAKMRRTGICGATESVVVDAAIADDIIPAIADALITQRQCEVVGCEKSVALDSRIKAASDEDWDMEYLDAKLSVKVVDNINEAIGFVQTHSSGHTDAIIASDNNAAARFLNEIDSAIVMHNASTQFADGGEFGMGAEIGIATGKLHARGPVGLEQLCTFKYQVRGEGQIRA